MVEIKDYCRSHEAHGQCLDNDKARLDMHGREFDRISVVLERLTVLQETMNDRLSTVEERVHELQMRPGNRFEKIAMHVAYVLVGGFCGAILMSLGLGG